jgi:hypothetical protein
MCKRRVILRQLNGFYATRPSWLTINLARTHQRTELRSATVYTSTKKTSSGVLIALNQLLTLHVLVIIHIDTALLDLYVETTSPVYTKHETVAFT